MNVKELVKLLSHSSGKNLLTKIKMNGKEDSNN